MAFLAALGPILSGVAGIASAFGAGGGGTTQQKLNLGKLRKSAEKHGFNPLTVLRAAGTGFSTTHHPSLSSAATLARAVSAGIQGFMQTGVDQETQQQERELLNAQLELIKAQTNRVRSSPQLGMVPRHHGTATAGPTTAAALQGRTPTSPVGPTPLPGFNPTADQASLQHAMERTLPPTVTQVDANTQVHFPAGTPAIDDVEMSIGEIGSMAEGVNRSLELERQNNGYHNQVLHNAFELGMRAIKPGRGVDGEFDLYNPVPVPNTQREMDIDAFRYWYYPPSIGGGRMTYPPLMSPARRPHSVQGQGGAW